MADSLNIQQDGLSIVEESCGPFWQITSWPETVGAVERMAADACGAAVPAPGMCETGGKGAVMRIAPLVWWMIGADVVPGDVPVDQGTTLDMTDNRKRFVISGARARDVMMRLAPLDFREKAFPVGKVASTTAHHMSVQIVRRDGAFDVYATATFAPAFAEVLAETAAQWG